MLTLVVPRGKAGLNFDTARVPSASGPEQVQAHLLIERLSEVMLQGLQVCAT